MVRSVRFAIRDEELRGWDRPRRAVWELDDLPEMPQRRSRKRERLEAKPGSEARLERRLER